MTALTNEMGESGRELAAGVLRMATRLGLLHLIVDLCTVTAICRAAALSSSELLNPFHLIVGYNVAAFALQLPLGMIVDRLKAPRLALVAGACGVALGLLCIRVSPAATMVVTGLGNALFHIGAGAIVLAASPGHASPSGVFVAPGALGLGAGMRLGRLLSWPVWPLGLLLVAGTLFALLTRLSPSSSARLESRGGGVRPIGWAWWVAITALSLSVVVRSFVGFGGPYEIPKTMIMMVGLPMVAFAGKLAGGYIADRIGWLESTVAALLLSAPLIAFAGGSPGLSLAGLLIFQSTMPVTLVATYLLLPRWPATAFGLLCLALIAGALPTFYPAGKALYGANTFLALIVTSAVAVTIALHLVDAFRVLPRADGRAGRD